MSALAITASCFVYIGTYTRGDSTSRGLYRCRFDAAAGKLSEPVLVAEMEDPSFLEFHPNRKYLYSVGRPDGEGAVSAYAINPETGDLNLLNRQPSGGKGPCHVTLDPKGQCVLVSNYSGGNASGFPVQPDGTLGHAAGFVQHRGASVNPERQEAAHVHSATVSPDGTYAYLVDLGIDRVMIYQLGAEGKLTPNDPAFASVAPGSGPRHMAFHPDGKRVYLINELNNTITAFSYDHATGGLAEQQTLSTLPGGFGGFSKTAEIRVHPNGKFLYGSNRGHNSIAIFHIDPKSGRLTAAGHQDRDILFPRNFNIDPSGQWCLVANKHGASVLVFRINQDTGALEPTKHKVTVDWPTCIRFLPIP